MGKINEISEKKKKRVKRSPEVIKAEKEAKAAKKVARDAAAARALIITKLNILDKGEIVHIISKMLSSGEIKESSINKHIPKPDMNIHFNKARALTTEIYCALPYSRYGSKTDNFGFKRAKSANNAAKKYILDNAKVLKKSKQWTAVKEYATGMIPIAESMVEFDDEKNNAARNKVKETLVKMQKEANKKLGISSASSSPSSSNSNSNLA
eukprot:g14673.t1